MSIITLTTDFGLNDWFVGTMKGVILNLAQRAKIVDITHDIPPGDIRAGAFALRAAYRYFPPGTVHLAVVDPGVGSNREAIAVRTGDYTLIGPDRIRSGFEGKSRFHWASIKRRFRRENRWRFRVRLVSWRSPSTKATPPEDWD
jgi:hypothetical protein